MDVQSALFSTKYRFPIRPGNRFELLVDGGAFIPRMLQAIDNARHHLLLEMYLVDRGRYAERFFAAVLRARERQVDVYLLLDGWGARALAADIRARLAASGAQLIFHNALSRGKWLGNLSRDHRKLLLVDGSVAFVGGAGITDDFDPESSRRAPWHDIVVQIEGPVLADWHTLFAEQWQRATGKTLFEPPAPPAHGDGVRGRVVGSSGLIANDLTRSVNRRLRSAGRRIRLATAYFVPPRRLRRLLSRAANSGVDTRLLLPGPLTDVPGARYAGRRYYARLLRAGIHIYEFQPSFTHTKVLLCDDWVSLGSSNLDRWNLRWNLDANQEIVGAAMADVVDAMFERDFARSQEWTLERWTNRPWTARFAEWIWGTVDAWMSHLSIRRL